jgi:hypothetical protein
MACPSIGISTQPTFTRFVYYKLLTLVPVSAAITAMLRHGESIIRNRRLGDLHRP